MRRGPMPAAFHSARRRQASFKTQSPMVWMSPDSSAMGMK